MESKQNKKWGIFEIEHFDFPGGNIADYEVKSQEEARALAIKTLKSDKQCMNYLPGLGKSFHKDIDKCEKVKQYHSKDTSNGETIRIDQNGLLYALGTQFGSRSWVNPYLSGDVGVNFSKCADNYYSTINGHQEHEVEEASSIIVENSHRGANATMYSDPKDSGQKVKFWHKEERKISADDFENLQKTSPDSEVETFLKKLDFSNKSWVFVIIKKEGRERFVQHNDKDGTYRAYRYGTDDQVDTGSWRIEGSTYSEKDDGSWKGKFEILGENEFYIHQDCKEHGYHRYKNTDVKFDKGFGPGMFNDASWFEVDLKENRFMPTHYVYRGDMGGGENHPRTWAL